MPMKIEMGETMQKEVGEVTKDFMVIKMWVQAHHFPLSPQTKQN